MLYVHIPSNISRRSIIYINKRKLIDLIILSIDLIWQAAVVMYLEEAQTVRGAHHAERSERDRALDASDARSVMDHQGMKYC